MALLPREKLRLIHLLPHVLTCANVACGVSSILFSLEGDFEKAAYLILFAAFFDLIDGKVARLVHSTTSFGVQLDSLADVVSFGVAPPVLIIAIMYPEFNRIGMTLVLVYTLATALRLARYNVAAMDDSARENFTGLPCPVPACFLAAMVAIIYDFQIAQSGMEHTLPIMFSVFGWDWNTNQTLIRIPFQFLMVAFSCLMVSTIPYPDFSSIRIPQKDIYQHTVIMGLIFCIAVLMIVYSIALGTFLFVLSGPVMVLRKWSTAIGENRSTKLKESHKSKNIEA